MTRHEQNIDIMHRMYDCRSAARGILGDSYVETLGTWRHLINRVKALKRLSTLQAVLDIGNHIEKTDGISLMLVMAAGVEMIESAQAVNAGATKVEGSQAESAQGLSSSAPPRAPEDGP